MEQVTTVRTTEEERVNEPARPGVSRQPTWQLDRSATATWRSNPAGAQQHQEEASTPPSSNEIALLRLSCVTSSRTDISQSNQVQG